MTICPALNSLFGATLQHWGYNDLLSCFKQSLQGYAHLGVYRFDDNWDHRHETTLRPKLADRLMPNRGYVWGYPNFIFVEADEDKYLPEDELPGEEDEYYDEEGEQEEGEREEEYDEGEEYDEEREEYEEGEEYDEEEDGYDEEEEDVQPEEK